MPEYSGNYYLNMDQMQANVDILTPMLQAWGWTDNAIAGMLGNAQAESSINPGIWQSLKEGNLAGGYGLLQWTPARNYINWCESMGLDPGTLSTAVERLKYEYNHGLQYYATSRWHLNFDEYIHNTELSPGDLAEAWLYNYERPKQYLPAPRRQNALNWWNYITNGELPPGDKPNQIPANLPMPIWFYVLKRYKLRR